MQVKIQIKAQWWSKMYQEKDCSIRLSGDAGVVLLGMVLKLF